MTKLPEAVAFSHQGHPSSEDLAGFLSGGLGSAHSRIEEHLSHCDECRREAVEISRLVRTHGGRRAWARPLQAAAVITLIFGATWWTGRGEEAVRLRSDEAALPRVEVLLPVSEPEIESEVIEFVWRPVAPDVHYLVQVSDTLGDVVVSESVSDTTLTIPVRALGPGQDYIWFIDALLPNGESTSSGIKRLKLAP